MRGQRATSTVHDSFGSQTLIENLESQFSSVEQIQDYPVGVLSSKITYI